ncbi:LamG-like jellyroll fold domain-containing protein [Actinoplanes sp. CA-131856]
MSTGPVSAAPVSRTMAPLSAATESSAKRLALASGERVEVLSQRTEYTQIFANPEGGLTAESAVMPQRVRREDGSWADVDLTLQAGTDGLRPRASVADVRFSDGGTGPMATLVRAGKSLTVSWPLGDLPTPAVSGDSATYAEVLPGVDLVLRATSDGFSHVLVVKTAAAANPKLTQISFELGGEVQFRRARDGSLAAVAAGMTVATAEAPMMWDSHQTAAPAARAQSATQGGGGEDPSTPSAPSDTAHTAPVSTELTASGDLVLRPDANLLSSATFPLFIDPPWSTGKSRWAYSTNNNSNNSDLSVARVGKDPDSGIVYRSLFEFPTTALKGMYVHDAYVHMVVDHSWSCVNTPNTLLTSPPISGVPRTAWKTTGWYLKMLAQVSSHANEDAGCADSPQPDMPVNFNTDAVKAAIQGAANAGSSSATFVMSAVDSTIAGESTQDRWKKYLPGDARLITDFDSRPQRPTHLYVNGVRCPTSSTATLGIGTTAVKFAATMLDDDEEQTIRATWRWEHLVSGTWVAMTAPAASSTPAGTLATSAVVSGAVNGQFYRFAVSGIDPDPYFQSSGFTDWCQFKIDTQDPKVNAIADPLPAGPGKPAVFTISSPDSDVVKFRYGWSAAVTEVAASGTPKSAKVTLSAPKYGRNTLYLQAVDSTGNVGDGSYDFDVSREHPPVARWRLESYPSVSPDEELLDLQPNLAGDTPLTANGVTFTDEKRLIDGKQATFNGNGVLTTAGPVLNTAQSFGMAAWVRLDTVGEFQNLIEQDGLNGTNFHLHYRNDDRNGDGVADKSICLLMRDTDDPAASGVQACSINTVVEKRWMHVAAAFDSGERKLRIWTDGVLRQEVSTASLTAWDSKGSLRIGNRMLSPGNEVAYLHGAVADVQLFDRAIVQEDLTGDQANPAIAVAGERGILDPVKVAEWNFENAVDCYDPAVENTCEALDTRSGFGKRLALTAGVDIADAVGHGNFAELDNTYFDDGIATKEYGWSQRNTAEPNNPVWQDTPVLQTDQSFTVTARVHLDDVTKTMTAVAAKGTKQSAFYLGTRISTVNGVSAARFEVMVPTADQDTGVSFTHVIVPDALVVDDSSAWHDLALTYDAGTRRISLYNNGFLKVSQVLPSPVVATSGPITVGSAWYTGPGGAGNFTDTFFGGIDDVNVYQGGMTPAQIAALYPKPSEA